MSSSAQQKHVIVSGAARGIGRAIARHFLQKGHLVFILDFNQPELHYAVTKHLASYSNNLGFVVCNLRHVSDIRSAVLKAVEFFPNGRIDVLINNAAIRNAHWTCGMSMDNPDTFEQWIAYTETNLTAPFALSQACIPYMKVFESREKQHFEEFTPSIIHISSFRAYQSVDDQEGYASAKAGLVGLTHSMAVTCKKWGIRVNLIAPGRIKADHETKEADEQGMEWDIDDEDLKVHATNRAGRPEDVVQAVEYLMSAGFVTGQELLVDGGASKLKNEA